jgi:peptidoglycan/LPS O-acetylase OafA/YrhL
MFYLADGYAAVYLFFVISGCALTYSFARRPLALGSNTIRRVIRLGVPMAASLIIAFILFAALPDARSTAASLVGGSAWLKNSGPPIVSVASLLKEILLEGLFLGHMDGPGTLLPRFAAEGLRLTPVAESFNSPVWTLHIELMGSLLVMVLVALHASLQRWLHLSLSFGLLGVLAAHPLGLFVLGHLLAPTIASPQIKRLWPMGLLVFMAGVAAASYSAPEWTIAPFIGLAERFPLPAQSDTFHMHSTLEAVLVFLGITFCEPLRVLIAGKLPRWVGRLSFSLYLVHFPILLTASCGVFALAYGRRGAALYAAVAGISLTFLIAWIFERRVDRPAINLSRRAGALLAARPTTAAASLPVRGD